MPRYDPQYMTPSQISRARTWLPKENLQERASKRLSDLGDAIQGIKEATMEKVQHLSESAAEQKEENKEFVVRQADCFSLFGNKMPLIIIVKASDRKKREKENSAHKRC